MNFFLQKYKMQFHEWAKRKPNADAKEVKFMKYQVTYTKTFKMQTKINK